MNLQVESSKKIDFFDLMSSQDRERGFDLIPLDLDLLLQRINAGGYSGQFLADAFISHYRTDQPFDHSLGKVIKLDAEAFRLFHSILHIRFIPGWNDEVLYKTEQQIKAILAGDTK